MKSKQWGEMAQKAIDGENALIDYAYTLIEKFEENQSWFYG
jgi:hypothetical protein